MRVWSESTKKMVIMIYGMVMGAVIVAAMLFIALPHLLENGMTKVDWASLIIMVFLGLIASLPTIFLQLGGNLIEAGKEKLNV